MAPATHPQAKFDPIPPNLDLHAIVDRTPNFEFAQRIPASKIRKLEFEKLVWYQVIKQGKPLVIEGWQGRLPKSLFSAQWLEATYNKKQEDVRDINAQIDIPMTIGHYLRSMRQLTEQWTPHNFRDERRQRLYLKDIDCPPEWHDYLRKIMPPGLFYWNENIEDYGANQDDLFVEERTAAPAGDLMSSLPQDMRAQNLMCYIGHEGTYTPAHREMCASLGQNIMVEASTNENGEKEGSSIWFMTETKDRQVVREYFLSMLGHDVEIEKHFAQINAWKKATFPVYIVEQMVGDFILIPPLAPHQVWNRGTRTMKVAWNRTTVETLDFALHEALPRARLVCRDEQYKNKAIIYFSLKKYHEMLQNAADPQMTWLMGDEVGKDSVRLLQLKKDFRKLQQLFTEILVDEMFSSREKNVEMIPFDSCITCSYCRSNIFNRFLTCKHCVRDLIGGDQDTYDVCMECYAMGRSCLCVSGLSFCEQWDWAELIDNYEAWRNMVIYNDGFVDLNLSPPPLEIARMKIGRKSLAQVCQEQLRIRPFHDITKPDRPPSLEPEEEEPVVVDEQGHPKKRKRKKKKGDTYKCHTCIHKDYTYRLAFCTNPGCHQAYCFGVLYRAFDMMPQEVLQAEHWHCPKCRGICNCGHCRRAGTTVPYEPKNTYIGHDTRAVADDRSQEVLVDFRVHNLNWLKAAGDESRNHNSKRIQRLRQQADAEKEKDQDVVDALVDTNAADTNDFEDRGEIDGNLNGDDAHGRQDLFTQNGAAEAGGLLALPDAATLLYPETAYPEPPGPERRLGMGYYEQDDSPDKILYNYYEEPNGEDMLDEEAELVKKALRLAKRRARQEDDSDPDFVVGKSHKKKKVDYANKANTLQNMDPALLGGEDVTMVDAHAEPQPQAPTEVTANDEQQEEQQGPVDLGRPFDPNIPTLRSSRPTVSYAEMEGDIEEFNETVPSKPKRPKQPEATPTAAKASSDPLDLAAEAFRAIANAPSNQSPPRASARRKGRPGRPRKSDATASSTPPTGSTKNRGRPSRASLAMSSAPFTDGMPDSPHDAMIGELEQGLAKELEDGNSSASPTAEMLRPRRRGRPPKKAVQVADKPTPITTSRIDKVPAPAPASSEKFLSMAERMALRGKKIKIGKRKQAKDGGNAVDKQASSVQAEPVTSRPTSIVPMPRVSTLASPRSNVSSPAPVTVITRASGSAAIDRELASRDPSPVVQPPKPKGPTIVRLGDSDDDDGFSLYSSSPSSSGNQDETSDRDSNEDMPAETITRSALRGRPAVRGRGARGRDRSRGRGRGRGRPA
ncbi:hypothetical protein M406DRAFT_290849 [Cryphonectria parasitica EP155]|uniref:JmjC domain-containing protein n=1 Tax=Cryphonectria parasitica (strain ATCC 38755 / EP155) TaxID=660469 RepID=A0A9P4Y4N2_CRYP1|nr:uncharacterized protein M406DRAFT_290849 [Cryphonectria parasitica EP155]KAF3766394.1 hypothetical protein M406DRAFT_290849 [Cryphonectria parasitica EP155]